MNRTTVTLPPGLKERIDSAATTRHLSFTALLQKLLVVGLMAIDLEEQGGDNGLVIRKDGHERLIKIV